MPNEPYCLLALAYRSAGKVPTSHSAERERPLDLQLLTLLSEREKVSIEDMTGKAAACFPASEPWHPFTTPRSSLTETRRTAEERQPALSHMSSAAHHTTGKCCIMLTPGVLPTRWSSSPCLFPAQPSHPHTCLLIPFSHTPVCSVSLGKRGFSIRLQSSQPLTVPPAPQHPFTAPMTRSETTVT